MAESSPLFVTVSSESLELSKLPAFETTSKTHWNEWQLMSTGTKTKANFYFPRRKKHDGAISEYILLLKLIDNMQNVWADK